LIASINHTLIELALPSSSSFLFVKKYLGGNTKVF